MAKLGIITGVSPNDNLGDTLLEGAIKINSNFNEIYNYFGNSNDLTSGVLNKTSVGVNTLSNIGIGTTNPTSKLTVSGNGLFSGVVTATSFSGNATSSTYATTAGIATYANTSGIATYSSSSGIATYASVAGIATIAVGLGSTSSINTSGIITASNFALSTGTGYVGFSTYQTLTSGTSWTVPTGVRLIKVYATGGGGGGGLSGFIRIYGGSGATAIRYYQVTPGTSASYTIGAGGIGTASGNGTDGGNTTFTYVGAAITGVGGKGTNADVQIALGGQVNLYGGSVTETDYSTTSVVTPQLSGYGLGGKNSQNGQQGAIIIEY